MHDDGHWLNADRLRGYPRLFLALYVLFFIGWGLAAKDMVDPFGKPIGADFITFWSASRIALDGAPAEAYLPLRLFDVQRQVVPGLEIVFAWHYPPTFFLVVLPLSLLPYSWSYLLLTLSTLGLYWEVVRRITVPLGIGIGTGFFAFPGLFVNALHGQNAFLTGFLLGAALLLLERRPLLSGVCAGLLMIKPQLAVLLPVAFVCARAWTALAAAAVSAAVFAGLSVGVFGVTTLEAFLSNLHFVRLVLEQGGIPWEKMPTIFAFSSLLGIPPIFGYALQTVSATIAVGAVAWIWRQPVAYGLKAAALITGTLLVSPYLFDYDLALLALPLAWYAVHGLRMGWRYGERELLAVCWLLPALVAPVAIGSRIQLAPFVLLFLLWLIIRRGLQDSSGESRTKG